MNAKEIKLALKGKLNKNKSIAGAELDALEISAIVELDENWEVIIPE